MPNVYTRQCAVLVVAEFNARGVSIERSFRSCIATEYKPLTALSLTRILLPGSVILERIVSNKTLRLVNVIVSQVYVTSSTAHSTTLGCSKSSLKMLVSSVQTDTLRACCKMYFQFV
jgi:hypothetical protein